MASTPAATRSMPFDNLFWSSSSSAFRSRASNTRPRSDDAAKRRYWPTTSAYVVSWWIVRPVPRPLRRVEWAYQGVIAVRRRRGERDLDGLGGRLTLLRFGEILEHFKCFELRRLLQAWKTGFSRDDYARSSSSSPNPTRNRARALNACMVKLWYGMMVSS